MRAHTQQYNNARFDVMHQSTIPTALHNSAAHQQNHVINQNVMYYNSTLRRNEVVPGPHRVNQNGTNQQSMYVNHASFGSYAAVQYQPQGHSQQYHPNPVIIHAHDVLPMASRYVSIPVQGSLNGQVPTNGTVIYFQQPTNLPNMNGMPSSNQAHNQVRSPPKGVSKISNMKKNRVKSNGSGDPNIKSVNALLEDFRADKSRLWTAFDAKGENLQTFLLCY